jgi:glycosyltransferase involved in cell wall biosynthesis
VAPARAEFPVVSSPSRTRVPSVDVVVPCYKYGHLLPESVGSVLDQPGVDVRVLVVDDASPDDSAAAARALAAADPRVEVRVHERNAGHIATYNEGLLGWARADYSVLLSADDKLAPGALARATALLDAHPEVGFVYGHYIRFDGVAEPPPARTEVSGWTVWSGQDWLNRRFRAGNGCIGSPEVVVRTDLQQQVGGYDPALPHSGDIEMWMRLAAHADVGYVKGVDQAYYRSHGENMSVGYYSDGGLRDLRQRWAAYRKVLEDQGDRLDRPDRLDRAIRRKIAKDALWRASRAYDRRRTGVVPVAELVAFAEEVCPDVHRSAAWAGLRARQAVGPRTMPYLQPLVLSPVVRRFRQRLWWESWRRRGV